MKLFLRVWKKRILACGSVYPEVIFTTILFLYAKLFSSFIDVLLDALYFIILLEVVRILFEYVRSNTHRVKMRFLMDAGMVTVVRELIILIVDHGHLLGNLLELTVYLVVIAIFILYRYLMMKFTPDWMEVMDGK